MQKQAIQQMLVAASWRGVTDIQLNLSYFPDVLQPVLHQIIQSATSSEDAFYKILSMADACILSGVSLPVNSFSLEQMAVLRKINHPHIKTVSSTSCNFYNFADIPQLIQENVRKDRAEQDVQVDERKTKAELDKLELDVQVNVHKAKTELDKAELNDHENVQQTGGEDYLVAKFALHTGPKPLPECLEPAERLLPQAINDLVFKTADYLSADLLFWLLSKLGTCPMVLDPQRVLTLRKYFEGRSRYSLRAGENLYVTYGFMLRQKLHQVGGKTLRYMLPFTDSVSQVKSVFFKADPYLEDGSLDFDAIFEQGDNSEQTGAFLQLRWYAPERARQLFLERFDDFGAQQRVELLACFEANNSPDDEVVYRKMLKENCAPRLKEHALNFLRALPDSQYSKQCTEFVKQYVKFDPERGWKVKPFAYTESLKALGVTGSGTSVVNLALSKDMLQELLQGMRLEDILSLTGIEDKFEAWQVCMASNAPKVKGALFKSSDFNLIELLLNKLVISKDPELAAFVLENLEDDSFYSQIFCRLLMALAPAQRVYYLKKITSSFMVYEWFMPQPSKGCPMDFIPLDEGWSKALLEHVIEMVKSDFDQNDLYYFVMYLPYSVIGWLQDKLGEQNKKVEALRQKIKLQEQQPFLYNTSIQRAYLKYYQCSVNFIEQLLQGLEFRQQAEALIKQYLPDYYAANAVALIK